MIFRKEKEKDTRTGQYMSIGITQNFSLRDGCSKMKLGHSPAREASTAPSWNETNGK